MHQDIYLPPSVGVIIEHPGFWQELSGAENLRLFAQIKGIAKKQDILHWMEYLGLEYEDPRPVSKYSLGMRQKLGIAQAVMERPEILLLDEPMNALDKKSVELVHELLLKEKRKGTTIILASHRDDDFKDIAENIIEISEGKIV